MRVDGLGRAIGGAGPAGRTAAPGATFRLADPASPEKARAAAPPRAPASLDALLALQAAPDPAQERRKRAVRRGRGLLDALDAMKIALLDDRADPATLRALAQRLAAADGPTGDAGLDQTLAAIDLRAQVELAKQAGRNRSFAGDPAHGI